jgi:hypothetical protein
MACTIINFDTYVAKGTMFEVVIDEGYNIMVSSCIYSK